MIRERCVATGCDGKYFPAAISLVRSLSRTNPGIPVVVFGFGLTRRQKKCISRYADVVERAPFMEIAGRGKFSYIGRATMLKFEVVEMEFEKVLYLDSDMVVLGPIEQLFDIPPGRVGVVPEVNRVRDMFRPRDRERLSHGIDIGWEKPGFNAGLFTLYPREWKELKEMAAGLVDRFGPDVFSKSKDQQLLNILFSGHLVEFPKCYNFSPLYDEGRTDPVIIHYLAAVKPWHANYPLSLRYPEFREHISAFEYPAILKNDMREKAVRVRNKMRGLFTEGNAINEGA
ncbi:MAG: glycosyltransferase [Candidatus Omnitrophica bacterium]|nr:glycosyltransferase [Candidatus Omnitrophota bacterium]MDD5487797.1 glycosyltransferase [Candidatus Omnitrophota bacterium]